MTDERPDPDALLERVQADEARAARGRLKIFFGASAGVGKTFAMLQAAHAAHAAGTPLLVGLVETHGRTDTEALLRDLPLLARKAVPWRERSLPEFDLDAALAWAAGRADALVLLDELAHSNVPGSRHPKRWQDVEELLDAGVHVWTTLNVQHLESLNDIVGGITGVRVWETVPDRVFDEADEVVVVDLPPDELLQRLAAGKVYVPEQSQRAARNFFRKGNLLALRELALRRTADRVDGEMQAYRRQSAVARVWPNREAMLACVGPGEQGEKVVRACARLAAQLDVPWHAVHVETPALVRQGERARQPVLRVLKLAAELGAETAVLSAPQAAPALVRHAREHNLARVVVGRTGRARHWPWQRSLADAVAAEAGDLDVLQVALPLPGTTRALPVPAGEPSPAAAGWRGYAAALAACGAVALAAAPLVGVLELTNIVMLFLLVVVGIALGWGRGPAVAAAFLGVGLFDFFFVSPRLSFAVSDVQYLVTFGVMLVVALVVGQLTAGLKVQAEAALQREHRVRGLYAMSRDLSGALLADQVAAIGARFLQAEFGARSALLVAGDDDRLQPVAGEGEGEAAAVDLGVAQWAFDRGEAAGLGTDTLPASGCLVLPLKAPMRLRGVLAIQPAPGDTGAAARLAGPETRRVLETCASLIAISLERIHYIHVAQASTLQMESERLRNSLLSAISHDLRTPLTAMAGLADALTLTQPPLAGEQAEIARAMKQSALRMNALVANLLDMARLESGAVQLNRQWQPLEEVVGSALAAAAPVLAGRPVQVRLADDLPLLHLDATLIERVLVNLLENAAKYTPAGTPVTIAARMAGAPADAGGDSRGEGGGEGEAGGEVLLTVDDQGPGLPRGREEAIFEKFERGRKEAATPGVGLGLAICRAIVQAHGGRIDGCTRPEGGARFTIHLPRGEPPADLGTELLEAVA